MRTERFFIQSIPAVLYGELSDNVYIFIHGKCGCKEEAERFASVACAKGFQVLGVDLPEHGERLHDKNTFNPWCVVPELKAVYNFAQEKFKNISLRANSIGAYFAMLAFHDVDIKKSLFVSPIVNMNRLIENMMNTAGVTEEELKAKQHIATEFGETLDWKYLSYVRDNPIDKWISPTNVLYASNDCMTPQAEVESFCKKFGCDLTVTDRGEHWFHTDEQCRIMQEWELEKLY
jgi:esterase/lipase